MEEIHRRIPHRPPFRFVDRIIEITAEDATCELHVREIWTSSRGTIRHPIFPSVLLARQSFKPVPYFYPRKLVEEALNSNTVTPVLSRIRDARFKRMIKPGDTVEIKVFLQDQIGKFYNLRGEIRLDEKW